MMKKVIVLFVIALFTMNVNAQNQKKEVENIKVMTADSLIQNFNKILSVNELVSFSVAATVNGYEKIMPSKTGKLTTKQINLIKQVKSGSKVYIENIKAKNEKGKIRVLKAVIVKIK